MESGEEDFVETVDEYEQDDDEVDNQNDFDGSDSESVEDETSDREEVTDEELDTTETLDTTAESVTDLDDERALVQVKTEVVDEDEESRSYESVNIEGGLENSESTEENSSTKDSEFREDMPIILSSGPTEDKPTANDSEYKEDMPIILSSDPTEDKPTVKDSENKEDMPIILSSDPTAGKPTANDSEYKEDMPSILNSDPTEDKPTVKDSENKEDMPIILNSDPTEDKPTVKDSENKEDMPIILNSDPTDDNPTTKDFEYQEDMPIILNSDPTEDKPTTNDSEFSEKPNIPNLDSAEDKTNTIDSAYAEEESIIPKTDSIIDKPSTSDSEYAEDKPTIQKIDSTEDKPGTIDSVFIEDKPTTKEENADSAAELDTTGESRTDLGNENLLDESTPLAMEVDEESKPSCSMTDTESFVPEAPEESNEKSPEVELSGKTRHVAVKRIRDVRPPEPLPANVTTSITIGKPFFSAGGRQIEAAVSHAARRRESGAETKPSASMTKCINETCNGLNTEFVKAPGHAVLYYGYVPLQGKNRYKICKTCLDGSGVYLEKSKEAMKLEKSVFDVPLCDTVNPCSTVFLEVSDPESDEEDIVEDIELDDDIPDDVGMDQILEEMLGNLRLKSQVEVCCEKLSKDTDDIDLGFDATEELLEQADAELEGVRQEFQNFCGPTYNTIVLKSVEIDPTGKLTTLNSTDSETQEMLAANARNKPKPNLRKINPELQEILNKRDREVKETVNARTGSVSEPIQVDEIKELKQVCRPVRRVLAATPTVIPRIMPKVGDTVYGMKNNALSFWIRGTVLEVIRNTISGQLEYKVQFEINRKGKQGANRDVSIQIKNMNPKHISYNLPCPFVLPVGTRVIALFKDEFKNEPIGANNYYAGIVAEPPKNTNTYRYLIFFDDGYAQYVSHEDVLLVCEASKEVWNDVHPDTKEFVKNYILKYPERPMVRLQKGTMMSTEWNGSWWIARVVEVDCSLVKIFFEEDNRYEWIYRGSTRLAPLYTKAKGLEVGPGSKVPRRQNRGINSGQQKPVIEYTYEELPAQKAVMQTARKSTSAPPTRGTPPASPDKRASSKPYQKPSGSRGYADLVEFEGSITKIIITDVKGPIPFTPHQCRPSCVRPFTESDAEIRKINPLSLPMYLGWAREVGKTPKRTIFYRAPCGRRLRDYDDLKKYLRDTNYNMGIDYFCYDYSVDCLSEFVATRQHFQLRDISYGKEMVPVQCVNSVDHDYPEYVEYTRNRLPGKGVKINLDEEFLTCCDCTDDCTDKEKCSCWQLTIEGTNLGKDTMNLEVGYQNRRLIDHVVSGIYECNSRCKCRSTCSNRVVQNDLKWQLQIFKTATKGWAIRPLHDIPRGAFICVYAGQLLTEQGANEDGKAYGDEYLAELDYIEVIESVKEGYEAEAIEEENRRGGGSQDRRKRSYQDFLDGDDDSGEEDDHCKDTDFVVRLPSNRSTGGRNQDNDQRMQKSGLYSDSFDTSLARKNKPSPTGNADEDGSDEEDSSKVSTRALFGPDEQCYIMDAKSIGNIGRYLNHSCSPNVFVQNVFVDTHDIRFPWVAFFAYKHIRAGTELTWDYNYDIGSVPGKVMYCHCSSPDCRGRLL